MRLLIPVLSTLLASCVSVSLPGVVADTTQAGKEAYKAIAARKDARKDEAAAALPADAHIVNSYIGSDRQGVAEVKDACVKEALDKIDRLVGSISRHTVVDNTVALHNGGIVANCKVAFER
jgi:hypothetical protein